MISPMSIAGSSLSAMRERFALGSVSGVVDEDAIAGSAGRRKAQPHENPSPVAVWGRILHAKGRAPSRLAREERKARVLLDETETGATDEMAAGEGGRAHVGEVLTTAGST